ncbi:MAG: hypothetical protein ACRCV0_04700 [Brevinema sp.]
MIDKIRLKSNLLEAIRKHDCSLIDIVTECQLESYYTIAITKLRNENNNSPEDKDIIYYILGELYFKYGKNKDDTHIEACDSKIRKMLYSTQLSPNSIQIYNNNQNNIQISTITDISNNANIQNIIENTITDNNYIQNYDKNSDKKSRIDSCLNIIASVLIIILGVKPALDIIQEVLKSFNTSE